MEQVNVLKMRIEHIRIIRSYNILANTCLAICNLQHKSVKDNYCIMQIKSRFSIIYCSIRSGQENNIVFADRTFCNYDVIILREQLV